MTTHLTFDREEMLVWQPGDVVSWKPPQMTVRERLTLRQEVRAERTKVEFGQFPLAFVTSSSKGMMFRPFSGTQMPYRSSCDMVLEHALPTFIEVPAAPVLGTPIDPAGLTVDTVESRLLRAVEASGAEALVLVGPQALGAARPDLAAGVNWSSPPPWWCWRGRFMTTHLPHDAEGIHVKVLRDRVHAIIREVANGVDLTDLSAQCMMKSHAESAGCLGDVDWYDPDGVGWCKKHRKRGEKAWKEAMEMRVVKVDNDQEGML